MTAKGVQAPTYVQLHFSHGNASQAAFNAEAFLARLSTKSLGCTLLTAAELPSTQTLLHDNAGAVPNGAVCVADRQVMGKGKGASCDAGYINVLPVCNHSLMLGYEGGVCCSIAWYPRFWRSRLCNVGLDPSACRAGPQHMGVTSRLPHVFNVDSSQAARSGMTCSQLMDSSMLSSLMCHM